MNIKIFISLTVGSQWKRRDKAEGDLFGLQVLMAQSGCARYAFDLNSVGKSKVEMANKR